VKPITAQSVSHIVDFSKGSEYTSEFSSSVSRNSNGRVYSEWHFDRDASAVPEKRNQTLGDTSPNGTRIYFHDVHYRLRRRKGRSNFSRPENSSGHRGGREYKRTVLALKLILAHWKGANFPRSHRFNEYPAAFHASTPPFSTLTLVKPCSLYFAA